MRRRGSSFAGQYSIILDYVWIRLALVEQSLSLSLSRTLCWFNGRLVIALYQGEDNAELLVFYFDGPWPGPNQCLIDPLSGGGDINNG